jgi:hypothetical protein
LARDYDDELVVKQRLDVHVGDFLRLVERPAPAARENHIESALVVVPGRETGQTIEATAIYFERRFNARSIS